MTEPPVQWQVKVTPRDRGNLGLVKQRLESADLRSVRRRRSLLLGVRSEEEGEQVAERLRALPLPPVDVRVERVSRGWAALQAWFHGGSDAGGNPDLGDVPDSWGHGGHGGDGGDGGGFGGF